jgi:hypothetical protein
LKSKGTTAFSKAVSSHRYGTRPEPRFFQQKNLPPLLTTGDTVVSNGQRFLGPKKILLKNPSLFSRISIDSAEKPLATF